VRPHFIKAGPIVRSLSDAYEVTVINTGQHYDYELSTAHLTSAKLESPAIHLGIGSGSASRQVGVGLMRIESELRAAKPNLLLAIGDANSSLIGALAASQLGIPVCHVEAGVRKEQGIVTIEEVNRRVIDSVSSLLLTPTTVKQASLMGSSLGSIHQEVRFMGDVLLDSTVECTGVRSVSDLTKWADGERSSIARVVVTIHRAEHVENEGVLRSIVESVLDLKGQVVDLILHPRTSRRLKELDLLGSLESSVSVAVRSACPHDEMLRRIAAADVVVTDSSGVQREAYFLGRPCCVLRDGTEYPETLNGSGLLVSPLHGDLRKAVQSLATIRFIPRYEMFGGGAASVNCLTEIKTFLDFHGTTHESLPY
jgi:UDP-GlcNAc3NAcA epimerase